MNSVNDAFENEGSELGDAGDRIEPHPSAENAAHDSVKDKDCSSIGDLPVPEKPEGLKGMGEVGPDSRNLSQLPLRSALSSNIEAMPNRLVNNVDLEMGSLSKRSSGH